MCGWMCGWRRDVWSTCHFCHRGSWETRQSAIDGYECPHAECAQWNGFDQSGDYNSLQPPFAASTFVPQRASAGVVESPFLSEAGQLCATCQQAQENLVAQLAAWDHEHSSDSDDSDSDSSDDDEEDAAYVAFRAKATKAAQLCNECAGMVRATVRRQDQRLRRDWQDTQAKREEEAESIDERNSSLRCSFIRVQAVSRAPTSCVWQGLHLCALITAVAALVLACTDWQHRPHSPRSVGADATLLAFAASALTSWRWVLDAVLILWHLRRARTAVDEAPTLHYSSEYFEVPRSNKRSNLAWSMACTTTIGVWLFQVLFGHELLAARYAHLLCLASIGVRSGILLLSYTPLESRFPPLARRLGPALPIHTIPEEDEETLEDEPAPLPAVRTPQRRGLAMEAPSAEGAEELKAAPAPALAQHIPARESKEAGGRWPDLDLLADVDGEHLDDATGSHEDLDAALKFEPSLLSTGGLRPITRTQSDELAQSVWPLHQRVRANRMAAAFSRRAPAFHHGGASPRGLDDFDHTIYADHVSPRFPRGHGVPTGGNFLAPGSLFSSPSRATRRLVEQSPTHGGATHASTLISSLDLGLGGAAPSRARHWLSDSAAASPLASRSLAHPTPFSTPSGALTGGRASAIFPLHSPLMIPRGSAAGPISLSPPSFTADEHQIKRAAARAAGRAEPPEFAPRHRHLLSRVEFAIAGLLFALTYALKVLRPSLPAQSLHGGLTTAVLGLLLVRLMAGRNTAARVPLEQKAASLALLVYLLRQWSWASMASRALALGRTLTQLPSVLWPYADLLAVLAVAVFLVACSLARARRERHERAAHHSS